MHERAANEPSRQGRSGARKAHVVEDRWTTGGFQPVRYIRCRCGWKATHYNAGYLTELFKAHQAEMETKR